MNKICIYQDKVNQLFYMDMVLKVIIVNLILLWYYTLINPAPIQIPIHRKSAHMYFKLNLRSKGIDCCI